MTCTPKISSTRTTTPTSGSVTHCGARSRKLIAEQWPVFAESILERLAMGAEAYGDKSLDAPSSQLLVEIEQELLDVVGWGFIQWHRIQTLKAKMEQIERSIEA